MWAPTRPPPTPPEPGGDFSNEFPSSLRRGLRGGAALNSFCLASAANLSQTLAAQPIRLATWTREGAPWKSNCRWNSFAWLRRRR